MAISPPVQLTDFSKYNSLFDNAQIAQDYARASVLQNVAQTGTQDLADRATLRGLAGGLNPAHTDPGAIGTALSIPVGTGSVNSLTEYGKGQLAMLALQGKIPDFGGQGVSGLGPAAPNAAPATGDDQFIDKLGGAESDSNPAAVNKQGYNGGYQFGVPRLIDLNAYTPADGEVHNGKWNGKTNGTFNIPGFPDVKTQADFKSNKDAQRAVMHLQVSDLRKVISEIPGAENFDQTGLLAVGHLGGPGGLTRFVQSNGAYNPRDANGTSLMDYYKRFSSGGPVALQQAYGHPDGPLPADHPFHGTQVASNDPSSGTAPVSAQTGQSWNDVQQLVAGYRQPTTTLPEGVNADPGYLANRNAPVPGQGLTAPQAVAQATSELGDQLNRMTPEAANAAVTARAQQLLAGGGQQAAPAPTLQPAAVQSPPAPVPQQAAPVAPHPVIPGSNIMSTQPPQDTRFGPSPGAPQAAPAPALPAGVVVGRNRITGLPFTEGAQPGYAWAKMPDGSMGQVPIVPPKISRQQIHNDDGSVTFLDEHGQPVLRSQPNSRDVQLKDYERDAKEADNLGETSRQAGMTQVRLGQMMDLAEKLRSGSGGGTRADWARLAQTYLPPEWAAKFQPIGPGGSAAADELEKLATLSSGQQERSVLGARGGIQAINLFKNANPGLQMLPEANRTILIAQRIGAQADADYANGAVGHYNQNADAFRAGSAPYMPLSKFDQVWNAQRNPQIYAAAMAAANGLPWDKWTQDLKMKDPADVQRVIGIVRSAIPNAKIKWSDGTEHSVGVPQ